MNTTAYNSAANNNEQMFVIVRRQLHKSSGVRSYSAHTVVMARLMQIHYVIHFTEAVTAGPGVLRPSMNSVEKIFRQAQYVFLQCVIISIFYTTVTSND